MAKLKKTPTEIKYEQPQRKLAKNKPKPKKKKAKATNGYKHRKELPYHEFLQTSYWKLVRAKVIVRDGKKCVICGATKYLQVHHTTYKNRGNELKHLSDLMTLCRDCHKEHHYAQK